MAKDRDSAGMLLWPLPSLQVLMVVPDRRFDWQLRLAAQGEQRLWPRAVLSVELSLSAVERGGPRPHLRLSLHLGLPESSLGLPTGPGYCPTSFSAKALVLNALSLTSRRDKNSGSEGKLGVL